MKNTYRLIKDGFLLPVALLLSVVGVPTASAGSAGSEKIQVLIVDGFSNHDWSATTKKVRSVLEDSGLFEVDVSTTPSEDETGDWDTWRPQFSRYDVVVQNCNDIRKGPDWPTAVQRDLEAYVSGGGGLHVLHSGNNAFPDWPAYNQMIGLGWRAVDFGTALMVTEDERVLRIAAGEGARTSHGPRFDAVLTRMGDHPIHTGFPQQWKAADLEVYRFARGPAENLSVLSYTRDPKTQLNFPTEWVVSYGKGQVYSSTFGHIWHQDPNPPGARCVGFQTLLVRVTEWLARGEVTSAVPANFPDAETVSLYPPES